MKVVNLNHLNNLALTKPLLASLAIHSVLLLLIYFNQNNKSETNSPEQIKTVSVLLELAPSVQESLKLDEVIALEQTETIVAQVEAIEMLSTQVEPLEQQNAVSSSNEINDLIEFPLEMPLEENLFIESDYLNDSNTDYAFELPEFEDEQSLELNDNQRFSQDSINTAVSSYMSRYNQQLNQSWLAQCQRYKNQHGTKDCPRGNAQNNRVGTSLATSNSRNENINRINALTSAMSNASSDSQLRALSNLNRHYLSVITTPAKWTPQGQTRDSFNPELLGPTLNLGGISTNGATGLFGIVTGLIQGERFVPDSLAEQVNNRNAIVELHDEPQQDKEHDMNENTFIITPALFPSH